jgi:hypothetical protein
MHKVLEYSKDTGGTFRWDVMIDDAKFELYIYKWRVPQPVPHRVLVEIFMPGDNHPGLSQFKQGETIRTPGWRQSPIVVRVQLTEEHTKTYRYDPIGDYKLRETGCPYIPKTLLPSEPPSELTISVEWLTD